ncbi:MAG: hypothetical protein NT103_08615 [Campylobacterales bacterium]|nr:hypothetical protein [Campylobacterales bacterium]
MERFKIFICIDDTDEIGYHTSTGEICEAIREHIMEHYAVSAAPITRHQLFLHEDIPYTSHNSSMCFTTFLSEKEREKVTHFTLEHVENISAPSSDPGVCIAFEHEIRDLDTLIRYGFDAKEKVLTKESAYAMAKKQNLFLRELKNTGQGIIGAVAGIALRAQGSDGRIKGKFRLDTPSIDVQTLLKNDLIDEIQLIDGSFLSDNAVIITKDELKIVYLNHKCVLLVEQEGDYYRPLGKEKLTNY